MAAQAFIINLSNILGKKRARTSFLNEADREKGIVYFLKTACQVIKKERESEREREREVMFVGSGSERRNFLTLISN